MKKLKKSSNKKPFNVLVLYGAPAVGKFTVAKEIIKNINFKIFHNHAIKDVIWEFFPRGTNSDQVLFEQIVFLFFQHISENHINTVLTNTHSANFVSATGLTNVDLYKKIEKIIKPHGGQMLYVQLVADSKEIVKRVSHPNRKLHKKLVDKNIMEKVLVEKDWVTPAKLKNQIIIDNTKLSPKKVAGMIIEHFKLK